MFDSTMKALKINTYAIQLVANRINNTNPLEEHYEERIKRDLEEISTLSERVNRLTIITKGSIEIG